MRTVVVTTIISLDGFVAGKEDDLSVMPFDDGFSAYNVERLGAADTGDQPVRTSRWSSAANSRAETSSISPRPSTSTSRPRSR